ncbi:MAG: VOC family protein [Gammaproteobacteria bacterium]|nr:VOC family protein [Gammaproteobacteria bacterium]
MAAFEFSGINHLALVCKDMDRTIDFYTNVLGMPLTKTIDLPGNRGKHYFFDCGGGDQIAFFWFPDGPDSVSEKELRRVSAIPGTMNHLAFNVAPDKIDEYRERLVSMDIDVTEVVNHDDSDKQVSEDISPSTFVRSIYFKDPDGMQLEFAAWARELTAGDVNYTPPADSVAAG